ncbi:hypothetical protein GZ998_07120 [Actinomyces sp. 594]|uniref:hypothetical protein n=1 Tax=Actinomyces sp. 594 TaxID=2057793 RepID=UPI001C56B93F|nr:hypothetical protein [Actinomyces sp. 594]MBW3069273.1 hypothetical protein [Actinomyces sp. 594]
MATKTWPTAQLINIRKGCSSIGDSLDGLLAYRNGGDAYRVPALNVEVRRNDTGDRIDEWDNVSMSTAPARWIIGLALRVSAVSGRIRSSRQRRRGSRRS